MSFSLDEFWAEFSALQTSAPASPYKCAPFGDNAAMAEEFGALILKGTKTATCSSLWEYEATGEPLPQPGYRFIVLNGQEIPLCIIETTEVAIRSFRDVDDSFAFAEGENDRTLASWRKSHWEFFSRTLPRIDKCPDEDMPLVCEHFKVVFRHRNSDR